MEDTTVDAQQDQMLDTDVELTKTENWYSDEYQDFVNENKIESPEHALKTLKERMANPAALPTLAEKMEDAAYAETMSKLGAPDAVEKYQLNLREDIAATHLGQSAAQVFFDAKVPPEMARRLVDAFVAFDDKQMKEIQNQIEEDKKSLKSEWGSNYDKNIEASKRAAGVLGLTTDEQFSSFQQFFGYKESAKILSRIGELGLEGALPTATQDIDPVLQNADPASLMALKTEKEELMKQMLALMPSPKPEDQKLYREVEMKYNEKNNLFLRLSKR